MEKKIETTNIWQIENMLNYHQHFRLFLAINKNWKSIVDLVKTRLFKKPQFPIRTLKQDVADILLNDIQSPV